MSDEEIKQYQEKASADKERATLENIACRLSAGWNEELEKALREAYNKING